MVKTILVCVGVLCLSTPATAQDDPIPFRDVMENLGVSVQWDPYSESGQIYREATSVRFSVGSDEYVVNYLNRVINDPINRSNGTLMIPASVQSFLENIFPPPQAQFERRIAAIYIDPGHGGKDPGAIGRLGVGDQQIVVNEKTLVLDAAVRLGELLRRTYPDKEVLLSREDDTYLTLEERTEIANRIEIARNESVIFLSLHANASLNPSARGFEVWFLPPEVRRDNLVAGEKIGVDDPEVLSIINTIREEELTLESVMLARSILAGLDATIGDRSPNRGVKEESWYVVRNAKMPSVLVEIGFVTNPEELTLLVDAAYLARLVDGIYNGVTSFVEGFEAANTIE